MSFTRTVIGGFVALFGAAQAAATVPVIVVSSHDSEAAPSVSFPLPDAPPVVPPTREARPAVSFSVPEYELTREERELVASCLVLEAASQGEFGMRGVMSVIRNRARGKPELFTTTVLREKQFSALNKLTSGRETLYRVVRRAQQDRMWSTALDLVAEATRASWQDPTGGATHYTRTGERTPWTRMLARTVTIGRHAFYR